MGRSDIDAELAALIAMSPAGLRERWVSFTGRPLPQVSPKLLRLALAWELRASVHGGLPRATSQQLAQLTSGRTVTHAAQPGMRLLREWNGKLHIITINEDQQVQWNGRCWRSLSEVARAITGTRWSGPAFFGLRKDRKAA